MNRQEIPVECFFQKEGEEPGRIISRSFSWFLMRELENRDRGSAPAESPGRTAMRNVR